MTDLKGKIDFVALITVTDANPNGDPLDGNRPRTTLDGYGEISDVCVKRKIRNRFQDMGADIFVQSEDRVTDGIRNLKDRVKDYSELSRELAKKDKDMNKSKCVELACKKWIDVRAFGQLFAMKMESGNISLGIRGPVSIHPALSVCPTDVASIQITKSVNTEPGDKKGSDTMGSKHRVPFGLYKIKGSVNVQLAELTGFSDADAELLKKALLTLFENDASSARPEGSMEVRRLYWWQHIDKTPLVTTAVLHRSVNVGLKEGVTSPRCFEDFEIKVSQPEGIKVQPEIYEDGARKM